MLEIFHEINWMFIGALIIVSAVVSWVGDVVGMKLGKKRITFMRLRPKYTSRIISVITGVGIALVTLVALSFASETVRIALFSMKYVQNQITSLTAELQKNRDSLQGMSMELFESKCDLQGKQEELSRVEDKLAEGTKNLADARKQLANMKELKEKTEAEQALLLKEKLRLENESGKLEKSVSQLKKESEALKAGIQRLREGRIAALTGEILAQGVIPSDKPVSAMQAQQFLDRLAEEARALLAYRFGKKPDDISAPQISPDSARKAVSLISGTQGRWFVRMTALSNAVEGEPVMAKVTPYRTREIYKAREILAEQKFQASMPKDKVEEQIFRTLREVNSKAAGDGVLRNPLTGNLGSIDTEEFMRTIEKIAACKKGTTLQITAANDIYTEGPVRVKFTLK